MARIESEIGTPQGGFMKWIDDRFPFTKTMKYHVTEYYASKNFNIWYVFGVLSMVVLVIQLRHRHFPDHELQTVRRRCVRVGRVHHARCGVGLAHSLHALNRRIVLLHCGVPAHVPGDALRLLQEAARAHLDHRHADLSRADGRRRLRVICCHGGRCPTGARRSSFPCSARYPWWAMPSSKSSAAITRSRISR